MRLLAPSALAVCAAALLSGACSSNCNNLSVDIAAACLPAVAAQDSAIAIQVREACGTNCAGPPQCTAVLDSGALVLDMTEDQCPDPLSNCAQMPCQQRVIGCRLPPLGAGDYPVIVPGSPSRLLRVRASGGAVSCTLPVAADGGV